MKVLMFGWEFPAQDSGGLGVACEGLTRALVEQGLEVTFVAPYAEAASPDAPVTLLTAHKLVQRPAAAAPEPAASPAARGPTAPAYVATHDPAAPSGTGTVETIRITHETLELIRVNSVLTPYLTVETYAERLRQVEASQTRHSPPPPAAAPPPAAIYGPQTPPRQRPTLDTQVDHQLAPGPRPDTAVQIQTRTVAPAVHEPPPGYGVDLFREVSRLAFLGRKLGESEHFDLIHAHDWMTFMAGVEAKLASGKPLVVHIHSTEFDRSAGAPNPDIQGIERYGLRKADRIVVVSRATRDRIVTDYGIDPDRITVIYNGAEAPEPPRPAPPPDPPGRRLPVPKLVLFAGRITAQKGPGIFVEAARQVVAAEPGTRFVLAGAGDQLPAITKQIADARLQHHIHITGFLRGPELAAMFRSADLYVMPSLSEPFGLTSLEAARYGVPVIVTRDAGVTEVMPSAVQVPPGDPRALADAILTLLRHPQLAQELAAAARDTLQQLPWEKSAASLITLYRSLASRHARLARIPLPG